MIYFLKFPSHVCLLLLSIFFTNSFSRPIAIRLSHNVHAESYFLSKQIQIQKYLNQPYSFSSIDESERVAITAFPNTFDSILRRWWILDSSLLLPSDFDQNYIEIIDPLPERRLVVAPHTMISMISNRSTPQLDEVSDPFRPMQWHLDRIYASSAWNITSGSSNVKLAVIDVGTDITHPDLFEQLYQNLVELNGVRNVDDDGNGLVDDVTGWDFADWDANPNPPNQDEFHGTHVAGIALGARNGQFGIGVAPNVKLLALRAGSGSSIYAGYQAMYYCGLMGVDIINCSWGGETMSAIEADAVRFAQERGCTIFASAGNDGTSYLFFPASLPGVISVGATNRFDDPAQFSNTNLTISIWAPGVGIPAPLPSNGWGLLSGTSMASPVAAGVGALVKSINSQLTSEQIRNILAMSGDPLLRGSNQLEHRVNAWRALREANQISCTLGNLNWMGSVQGGSQMQLSIPITFQQPFSSPLSLYGHEIIGATWVSNYTPMTSNSNQTIWTGLLSARLPFTIRRGHTIQASYQAIADNRYTLYGSVLSRLAPSEVTLNDGQILATFSANGAMGLVDPYSVLPVGESIQVPPGNAGVMYHGSFLLAIRNTVLDNVWGNDVSGNDWEVPLSSPIQITGNPPIRVQATALPLSTMSTYNVQVNWTAQTVSSSVGVPAIDIHAEIQNLSGSTLTNIIAGWLLDFDIFNSGSNVGRVSSTLNMATMGYSESAERYGIWFQGQESAGVFRIPPTSAVWQNWGDQRKFELLTWAGFDGDRPTPGDYAMLLATSPFTLHSGSIKNFSIRLFHSSSQTQAEQKVTQWRGGGIVDGSPRQSGNSDPRVDFHINSLTLNSPTSNVSLTIYDVLGRTAFHRKTFGQGVSIVDLSTLSTGLYFIQLDFTSGFTEAKKLTKFEKIVILH